MALSGFNVKEDVIPVVIALIVLVVVFGSIAYMFIQNGYGNVSNDDQNNSVENNTEEVNNTIDNSTLVIKNVTMPYQCNQDVYNCENFTYQKDSQIIYEYCKIHGNETDVHNLDLNKDGIACEGLRN